MSPIRWTEHRELLRGRHGLSTSVSRQVGFLPNIETKLIHCGILAIELALDLKPNRNLHNKLIDMIRSIENRYYIPSISTDTLEINDNWYLYESMNEIISLHNRILNNRQLDTHFAERVWDRILYSSFNYLHRNDISIRDWINYVENECKRRIPFQSLGPYDIEYKTEYKENEKNQIDFINGFFSYISPENFSQECYNTLFDLCLMFFNENSELLIPSGTSLYKLGRYFFNIITDSENMNIPFFRTPFGSEFLAVASNYGNYSLIENADGELDCVAN